MFISGVRDKKEGKLGTVTVLALQKEPFLNGGAKAWENRTKGN